MFEFLKRWPKYSRIWNIVYFKMFAVFKYKEDELGELFSHEYKTQFIEANVLVMGQVPLEAVMIKKKKRKT